MKVGKLLKEKYGFDKQETIDRFIDQTGYSFVILRKILDDSYPVLLSCHIHDLAVFTGASEEELMEAQELSGDVSELRGHTPMGKPYHHRHPLIGVLNMTLPAIEEIFPKRTIKIDLDEIVDYPNILDKGEKSFDDPEIKELVQRIRDRFKSTSFVNLPIKSVLEIKDLTVPVLKLVPPSPEQIKEQIKIINDYVDSQKKAKGNQELSPMAAYLKEKYPGLDNIPDVKIDGSIFRYPIKDERITLLITGDKYEGMPDEVYKKIVELAVGYFNLPENIKAAQKHLSIDYPIEFVAGYEYRPAERMPVTDLVDLLDNWFGLSCPICKLPPDPESKDEE